jgi:hypothetical protein
MWECEPFAVAVRHHPVVAALPDVHRHVDPGEVEAPWTNEFEVVVEPTPIALAQGLAERRGHPFRELTRQRSSVDVVNQVA